MKLHYKQKGSGKPIILLHGVLGNLDNLNMLKLDEYFQTIQVDLRNHGLSPWSDVMNYPAMAQDIIELCHDLQLKEVIIIGHSMGGKVAMKLTELAPELIKQIVVLDIAPVDYNKTDPHHDPNKKVFAALNQCITQNLTDRKEIMTVLEQGGLNAATIQFLLKSFKQGQWLFNFPVINKNYDQIRGWEPIPPWLIPTLFIRGGNSNYIDDADYAEIAGQFPYAQIETVAGAGHNLHAEKTSEVRNLVNSWLTNI
ncbi:alpha/beta fold hydrolase [Orbaceae bacterium ESL0721]|nr:alpha/beta fold hydrolase [Orbaceae bacterium ESL0721]